MGERDLVPQFIAAYGAGDPPDIVQQYSSGTTKMVNGGYFRAVDDLFDAYDGKDNFREGTLDAYTYDGQLYGIPAIGGHHYIFYYRKDWFADSGIPNPETWEDVIRAGQVMTGGNRWAYGHAGGPGYDQGPAYFQLMLLSAGGEVVGDDGKAAFNSDLGVRVAEFQRDWIGKYGISPETIAAADDAEIEAGFRAGVYGSYIDGIWEYKQMAQQAADMFPNVGVAPIPKTLDSGRHVTYNDNWALFMPANIAEDKIAPAFELMTLWINVTDAPYGKLGGFLPILKSEAHHAGGYRADGGAAAAAGEPAGDERPARECARQGAARRRDGAGGPGRRRGPLRQPVRELAGWAQRGRAIDSHRYANCSRDPLRSAPGGCVRLARFAACGCRRRGGIGAAAGSVPALS